MAPDQTTGRATGLVHKQSAALGILCWAWLTHNICINNAVIYSANARAVAWECVGRVHKTADWTRPFLTPQATSAELPTKMATFGPFCPFLHVTFSFRAPCKTLPEWPLGKYKQHCTRLRHKRPDIEVTEKCDSVVEDLFYFGAKIGDNLDEDLGDKMILGRTTITGCHLLYQWLWDNCFTLSKIQF